MERTAFRPGYSLMRFKNVVISLPKGKKKQFFQTIREGLPFFCLVGFIIIPRIKGLAKLKETSSMAGHIGKRFRIL